MAMKNYMKPLGVTKNCRITCTSQSKDDFVWNGCIVVK